MIRDRDGRDDAPWSPLEVVTRTTMGDGQRGGAAVVLLHGWGAPGDDLVPMADELAHPRARFFFPAAPLPEYGGGRAWWHLDPSDRPAHAHGDEPPPGYTPHRHVVAARDAVAALLREIRARWAPERIVLGGFSQGAMLSLDVMLSGAPVDRVAALSGVLLADSLPGLRAAAVPRPIVFAAHGRQDEVLHFKGGDRAQELLVRHGFDVAWHPFDGGHEIPRRIVDELRGFLFEGLPR